MSPPPPPQAESFGTTHAITLILTILLLVLFFVGFFSIYFCRCFMENVMNILNNRRTPMGTPVNPSNADPPGLDPDIINAFPTFAYSSVKDYRRPENQCLECAICLSEFQTDDLLRLITDCYHVFHKDCIDLWLASHKSCPVCRRTLDPNDDKPPQPADDPGEAIDIPTEVEGEPSCSITVKEEEEGGSDGSPARTRAVGGEGRFSRSHSTGHSIVADKYTLRLPEHVIARGHMQTLSCTTLREISGGHGRRCLGEISGNYYRCCGDDNHKV